MILSEQYRPHVERIRQLAGELTLNDNLTETARLLRLAAQRLCKAVQGTNGRGRKHHEHPARIQGITGSRAYLTAEYWLGYAERWRKGWAKWNRQYKSFGAWLAANPGKQAGWLVSAPTTVRYYRWPKVETGECHATTDDIREGTEECSARDYVAWHCPYTVAALFGPDPHWIKLQEDLKNIRTHNANGNGLAAPSPSSPPQWQRVGGRWYNVAKRQVGT